MELVQEVSHCISWYLLHNSYRKSLFQGYWNSWIGHSPENWYLMKIKPYAVYAFRDLLFSYISLYNRSLPLLAVCLTYNPHHASCFDSKYKIVSGVARRRKVGGHKLFPRKVKSKKKKKKGHSGVTAQDRVLWMGGGGGAYNLMHFLSFFFIKLLGYVQSVLKLY